MERQRKGSDRLEREAAVFARYLIGRDITPEIANRYMQAEQRLPRKELSPIDQRVIEFAVAWPWSIASLDAACALLRPQSLLRDKLVRLAAVLEASPEFADEFLPESRGLCRTLLGLGWIGTACVAEFLVGAALLKLLDIRGRVPESG
jgi:hypothetical protein